MAMDNSHVVWETLMGHVFVLIFINGISVFFTFQQVQFNIEKKHRKGCLVRGGDPVAFIPGQRRT